MRLKGKAIVVTGSTTGIGEAMARRFVAEGASVLIHGREDGNGPALVTERPASVALHVDDLEDPSAPRRLVDACVRSFGKVDAVVNNAAIVPRGDIEIADVAQYDRVMAVNVRAPLLLIKAALPFLRETQGCVLNIGSINGHGGEANLLVYSMSKGALLTMSRNLAEALGRQRVRVNHFVVGWVLTETEYKLKVADGLPPDWPTKPSPLFVPSGKMTRPEDIAGAAVYWVSDESRPFSGSVIDLEQYPVIGRNAAKESDR